MSIIINGVGLSGSILALMLSELTKGALDINLIEVCSLDNRVSLVSHPRYIALSRSSYYKLMSFFDPSSFLFSHTTPIKQVEISSTICQNKVVFSSSDYHIFSLGYVIELDNIKRKILNILRKSPSVKLFYPAKLKKITRGRFDNLVTLDDGNEVTAKLLIAADGSYSFLADLCGMEWKYFDYSQIAIVTNITTSFSNEGRAFEIFTTSGSLAVLPISNNRSFLIWCVPLSYKKEILNWSAFEFCQSIQKIFGWELGYILDVDELYFYSLFLRKANRHISHRLALVGNAAQTLHPIAGQGFNLGFRDVFSISKIISEAYIENIDIGGYSVLNRYQKSRQSDQSKIIDMTHNLVCLFNNSSYSCIFFKKCILSIIEHSRFLRNVLIKEILSW